MLKYCFVLDSDGKQLSPTLENKAWYMIRKKKATLVSKYPMVIQLKRSIPEDEMDWELLWDEKYKDMALNIVLPIGIFLIFGFMYRNY